MKPVEILLVEDNAGDAVLIRQVLADYMVPVILHIARDGEQALSMVGHSDFKPDLIILDLDIPRVSGTALLEVWGPTHAPVVVFSSSLNERPRVLQLGAREFVPKPADFQAFTDAVREIVRKWAVPKAYESAV